MKKVLLVTAIALLSIANVSAQDIQFGVKGGLNFATVSGDNTSGIEPVTSFNFGILAEIPISQKFSLQPELLHSGQGYHFDDKTVELNYLNLPLMGKYYLTKGLNIEAGPQLGYLLSIKNAQNPYNTIDFGANFGIGYKFDNGLNLGARYNLGISDISKASSISSFKNNVLQLSVSYMLF